jgi:quinol monooxygenase YgiN
MFAVAGQWTLDGSRSDQQREALDGIVAGVRQLPGFVRGFWSRDATDPTVHLTYVVFERRDQAESFRQAVAANAPAQAASGVSRGELRLVEVEADA